MPKKRVVCQDPRGRNREMPKPRLLVLVSGTSQVVKSQKSSAHSKMRLRPTFQSGHVYGLSGPSFIFAYCTATLTPRLVLSNSASIFGLGPGVFNPTQLL